jgi:TusA-related sulfurtransferase
MAEIKVNCVHETCPVPLVETRKAIRQASVGDIIEVIGSHPVSKKEIPMAVKEMGLELLEVKEDNQGIWTIRIRR